jgi:hypothetical protein
MMNPPKSIESGSVTLYGDGATWRIMTPQGFLTVTVGAGVTTLEIAGNKFTQLELGASTGSSATLELVTPCL